MSVNVLLLSFGCLLAWLVLMPIFAIGGGVTLFTYALLAELMAPLFGREKSVIEPSVARAMAHRMCLGIGARREAI